MKGIIDIEVYEEGKAQAKFLVRGSDTFWTDDFSVAIGIIAQELERLVDDE